MGICVSAALVYVTKLGKVCVCIHIGGGDICVSLLAKFIKLFEPAEILLLY